MRSLASIWFFLPLLLAHGSVQAQIYMCKDEKGRPITSDRPILECIGRTIKEFDKKGIARREIPPPPTAEQKREIELQEQKRKAEEIAAAEQRHRDRALRLRYSSEDDIETARKREVAPLQESLKRDMSLLLETEKKKYEAQVEANAYKKKNAAIPVDLQRKITRSDETIGGLKKVIQEREEELAETNAKFDESLRHFRRMNDMAVVR